MLLPLLKSFTQSNETRAQALRCDFSFKNRWVIWHSICLETLSFRDTTSPSNGVRYQMIKLWSSHGQLYNKYPTDPSPFVIRRQCAVSILLEIHCNTSAQAVVTAVRNLVTVQSIFLEQTGLTCSSEDSIGGGGAGEAIVFRSGGRRRPCNQPSTTNSPPRTCRFKHRWEFSP